MRLKVKLNILAILNHTFTSNFNLTFDNTSNFDECAYEHYEDITSLKLECSSLSKVLYLFLDNEQTSSYNYDSSDMAQFSDNGNYVIFECDIDSSNYQSFYQALQNGFIDIEFEDQTILFAFKQNSDNEHLNKSLTLVDIMNGKFNHSIGVKNINIDISGYSLNFNYVYILSLKRYYYVDSVEIVSADISRLHLKEDVLMTWKNLIMQQKGLIIRWQKGNLLDSSQKIVDERLPLESVKTIEYITPTPTGTGSKVNITLKSAFESTDYNFLVSVNNDVSFTKTNVTAPDSNLPNISPIQSTYNSIYFLKLERMNNLMKAIVNESNIASSINSILFLPFVPTTPYNVTYINSFMVGLPTSKALCSDDKFHYLYDIPSGVYAYTDIGRTTYGTSPYLVLADFTFPTLSSHFYDHSPYADYEIYIAFVGWVKVNALSISGKRIIIYYTIDSQTGNGNVFLYNVTDGKTIYSASCQLGVKLDVLSSNALELARERQANELNTLIGLLASAVSIGAGVISENPVAIAGGVLSAGKTIASAVNKERMMFERGQVSYGSSESGIHSSLPVVIRKTYNKPVIISASTYATTQGYPINQYDDFDNYDGYVEIGDLHFDPMNENIYQDEITEIVSLLKNGVVF